MVQITLVSPLTRTGAPIPTAPRVGAAAITAAKRRKHRRYPELVPNRGGGQRLLVLACEIGGRWRSDCLAVAPSSAPHCRGRARRGPQWLAAPMVEATQCRPPASGGQHRAGPPVDPSATARWAGNTGPPLHPRFGASRWPQPPAPAVTFHPNRADGKRRGRKKSI